MTLRNVHAHNQETTTSSLTDTLIDHGAGRHAPTLSFSSDVDILENNEAPDHDEGDTLNSPGGLSQKPRSKLLPAWEENHSDSREVPHTIPPNHKHRTLVLCFDGTGDQFDLDNSNVVQLFSLLKRDDNSQQMVYYQAGIGTYTSPRVVSPIKSKVSQLLDAMIASNLDTHVIGGYEFLMQHYISGDRICIFGFSRGAYTARSLAGMLYKVGLLPTSNVQQVPFAYKMYTRNDKTGWKQSTKFRKTFSREVAIEFIGVWDTVDSVGIIPKQLPFTGSNRIVRTFRHALSLDERRAKFKANMWNRPEPTFAVTPRPGEAQWPEENEIREQELRMSHQSQRSHASDSDEKDPSRPTLEWVKNDDRVQSKYEENFGSKGLIDRPTDVEEVWFAGCHCDVGGGSVKNTTRHSLAKISLRWMIRECFKTNSGIMFDSNRLRSVGLDPSSLHPFVTPRPSPIAVHTDMRIRPRVPGERAPGLIKQIVSDIEDSLPTFKTKVPIKRRGRMKELEVKADNDRTESMTPPRTAVQSASSKILGSVRNRFRRTVDSGKLPSKCAANPSSGDPSEVSVHPGRSLTEEEEDLYDAMSPKYDQLKLTPTWWILEYIPMQFSFQGDDDYRLTSFGMNRARPRHIPRRYSEGIKVHRTVRMRMETTQQNLKKGEHKRYVPKAPLDTEKIIWVD